MKYIKKLEESFQLFKQDDETTDDDYTDDDYVKHVKDACYEIATAELGLSENNSDDLGRLELVMEQIMSDRQQEFNTILVNCKQLRFRPNYCAEVMYHTIHQGRLNALAEREWMNGGFKR